MNRGTWTEARKARLTELWGDGVSAGLIAKHMGLTKNAIVGKAHRMELPGRPSPINRSGKSTLRRAPVLPERQGHRNSKTGLPKGMTKMFRVGSGARFRACQWIAGSPSADDACKCGAETGASRLYCSAHEARARRPVQAGQAV